MGQEIVEVTILVGLYVTQDSITIAWLKMLGHCKSEFCMLLFKLFEGAIVADASNKKVKLILNWTFVDCVWISMIPLNSILCNPSILIDCILNKYNKTLLLSPKTLFKKNWLLSY